MTLKDIIRHNDRAFKLATTRDPATSMITSIISLDHRVIDTYIADASEDAPPPSDPAYQGHIQERVRKAHLTLHQQLLDGHYDDLIDNLTRSTSESTQRSRRRRTHKSDEFVAVDQGPETFAPPTRDLPVMDTLNPRTSATNQRVSSTVDQPVARVMADPQSRETITAPTSSFPRLSAEPSEAVDTASPAITQTGNPSTTLPAPPATNRELPACAPPPPSSPASQLFSWADDRNRPAVLWHGPKDDQWTPMAWTPEAPAAIVDKEHLPAYLQQCSQHIDTLTGDGGRRTAVITFGDRSMVLLFDEPFLTIVVCPSTLLGATLNQARRFAEET